MNLGWWKELVEVPRYFVYLALVCAAVGAANVAARVFLWALGA